jgi:predicted kinase
MSPIEDTELESRPAPVAALITGIPGSGKSTVAQLVAAQLERAAHIPADAVGGMLVSGRVDPRSPERDAIVDEAAHDDAANRQLLLRARNCARLCDSFFSAGVTPLIDDVVIWRGQLRFYAREIAARPLVLIVLAPPLDVVRERERRRGLRDFDGRWDFLDQPLREELGDVGCWLDTSTDSPERTAARVLETLESAAADPSRLTIDA